MIELVLKAWEMPAPASMKLLVMTLADNAGHDSRFGGELLADSELLRRRTGMNSAELKNALEWLRANRVVYHSPDHSLPMLHTLDLEQFEKAKGGAV